MSEKQNRKNNQGFSIVELIVALSIISILLTALIGALLFSLRAVTRSERESRAYFYAQDAIEAVKNIRDREWEEIVNVTVGDIVHPEQQSGEWKLVAGGDSNDMFSREVVLNEVLRDVGGDIVESGGIADDHMRLVSVTVDWDDPSSGAKNIKLANYVTDWQHMDSFIEYFHQTNESDFAAGILDKVNPNLRPGDLLLERTFRHQEDFDSYVPGLDPTDWFDSEDDNGLNEEDNFKTFTIDSTVFGTTSTSTNIHSHYNGLGSDTWTNYEVEGRMMLTDDRGGIGITFFSRFPNEAKYFRLLSNDGESFHIDAYGTSLTASGVDDRDTEIELQEDTWFRFKIRARDVSNQTLIVAKVWEDGTLEPSSWSVDCYSAQGSRSSAGTIGFWTIDQGDKYFDDIEIRNLDEYEVAGTLESMAYDTGQASNFDKMFWGSDLPVNTTLRLQIRTAGTLGDLASATWYGPNGAGTYFQTNPLGEKIHADNDGQRWVQYKVFLDTTDTTITPSLEEVTISYAAQ